MILLQGLGVVAFWIVLPVLIGDYTRNLLKIEASIAAAYLVGILVMWALFQLLAVPLILLKSPFLLLVLLWLAGILVLAALACRRLWKSRSHQVKREKPKLLSGEDKKQMLGKIVILAIMCLLIGQQGYMYLRYMHLDEDDSRFVVNAVDAYEYNTMLLTNPATGEYVGIWEGEVRKDVASPWSLYYAVISKLCNIYPTIMAHSIMPVFLIIMAYAIYWQLGKHLFGKSILNVGIFVLLIAFLNIYFGSTIYTESVFLLTRIWQGKAIVAGVMLPLMFWWMMEVYIDPDNTGSYFLLGISNISICLMSGMGIILGGIFIGCFGFIYFLFIRKLKMAWKLLLTCIPNVVYGLVYLFA